jgi:hypothetical protein
MFAESRERSQQLGPSRVLPSKKEVSRFAKAELKTFELRGPRPQFSVTMTFGTQK